MRRKHLPDQFAFALDHEALVLESVVSFFADQFPNFPVFQEKLVKPGNLGENL